MSERYPASVHSLAPSAPPTRVDDSTPLQTTADILVRHRLLIAVCIFLAMAATTTAVLMRPRTYTTSASFMPQASGGSLAGLSNLAAQFGVNVGKDDPTQSPDFYAQALRSRDVLIELANQSYDVQTSSGRQRGTLAQVLHLQGASAPQQLEDALKALRLMIVSKITRQTGIITVDVKTPYPDLSEQVAGRLISALEKFNTRIRQNRAEAEEKFLQQREDEARAARGAAEDQLVQFLQRNRNYQSSPNLNYEFTRLSREAAYRSEVVSTLTQGHAQARIEAARNTPVITVVEKPNRALHPDGRGLAISLALAIVLGSFAGIALALLREGAARRQYSPKAIHT